MSELVDIRQTDFYRRMTKQMTPGKYLRVYRERDGLTQADLAEFVGTSASFVSALERERCGVSEDFARRFATFFDVPISRFLVDKICCECGEAFLAPTYSRKVACSPRCKVKHKSANTLVLRRKNPGPARKAFNAWKARNPKRHADLVKKHHAIAAERQTALRVDRVKVGECVECETAFPQPWGPGQRKTCSDRCARKRISNQGIASKRRCREERPDVWAEYVRKQKAAHAAFYRRNKDEILRTHSEWQKSPEGKAWYRKNYIKHRETILCREKEKSDRKRRVRVGSKSAKDRSELSLKIINHFLGRIAVRKVNVNKDNIRNLFDKAMGRVEKEMETAVACYRWAQRNNYDEKWTEAAGKRLTRALGVKVDDFDDTMEAFGQGDLDRGAELMNRFGAGRLDDVRKKLSPRFLPRILKRIHDEMTPEEFDAVADEVITELGKKYSEAGKRLNENRKNKSDDAKIAGKVLNWKKLFEYEKEKRIAAEKRADELQKQLDLFIEKAAAVAS